MAGFAEIVAALNNIAQRLGTIASTTTIPSTLPVANGGTGATTAAGARTNLGLGTIATQDASAVAITGGTATGMSLIGVSVEAVGTLQVGASGSSGEIDLFPPTANKGSARIVAADNTGNTLTTLTFGGQAASRHYTIPDQGADSSLVMAQGSPNATGFFGDIRLPLVHFKNSDGTGLAVAASAGKFGIQLTVGTSEWLLTEAANANTKTDVAVAEFALPPWYKAGSNITVTANCNYTLGTGTLGTHTLAVAGYLIGTNGTFGANLITTAAQAVPASAGDVTFTITGTTLSPGSRMMLSLTLVIQETGGTGNITAQVNSVRLS